MTPALYSKHFIPLESNPEVFNELMQSLGISDEIAFEDVLSLEPDFLPHPVLAVILVFPTTDTYEEKKAGLEAMRPVYFGSGYGEPIAWFRLTINNACGLYAVLHALCNSEAKSYTKPNSLLARLLRECIPLPPDKRAEVLESSQELEQAYAAVAQNGDSAVPDDPEDEVDFLYICFARSDRDNHIYELDGDSKGPVDTGRVLNGKTDLLAPEALALIKHYIDQGHDNINFNLMALARRAA